MMYETTSKETKMMHGRTTNEAAWVCRHMCTVTKQFHRVACWSRVSSWHIQNRNCVEAARSCVATSAKETHISAKGHRKLDTFLSFLSESSAIVPQKKTCGQQVSRAARGDYMCPRKGGKDTERYSTASNKVGPH